MMLLALAITGLSFGAEPRWQVDRWTMRDGLPQNSVTDLLQAEDGVVWLTTFGGIARFDGIDFRHFTPANTPGLDANRFVAVAQGADGALWFGSEHRGAFVYREGRFTRVGRREPITDLAADGAGRMWAAAGDAFVELSADPPRRVPVETGTVVALATLPNGRVVGSGFDLPWRCATAPHDCLDVPAGPDVGDLERLGVDAKGRLWLNGVRGVAHFDAVQRRWVSRVVDSPRDVLPGFSFAWDDAQWWLHGRKVEAVGRNPFVLPPSDAPVKAFLTDDEGGLWLGLDGGGLWRVQSSSVTLHHAGRNVGSVARDAAGTIWTGGCGGLQRLGAPVPEIPAFVKPRCPVAWSDGQGGILATLLGTDERTLVLLRFRDGQPATELGRLQDAPPRQVHAAYDGPWFSIDGTLYHVSSAGLRAVARAEAWGGTTLRPLRAVPDRVDTEVWVTVDGRSLLLLRDGTVARSIVLPRSTQVRDVVERGDLMFVSTYGSGLWGVRDDTVIGSVTPRRGMCDFALSHIFDPGDGTLWFNTNRGLGRVDEADLRRAFVDPDARVSCHLVDSGEANGGTGVMDAQGHVWAPTIDGLAELDTQRELSAPAPRLVLQSMRLGDQDLLGNGERAATSPHLTVAFAGLQFRNPRAVRYRYRLVGRDTAWSEPTTVRELHWHLPPGRYRFEVAAIGASGLESKPISIAFERRPEIWEATWFRLGLPLGLVGSIAMALWTAWRLTHRQNRALQVQIRVRERAEADLRREQATRERAQQELHESRRLEAIGRLAGGIAHDFNNLLTVVSSHASQLETHDDATVRQAADSLERTVARAATLTRRLLVVGRKAPAEPETFELGRTLHRFVPLLRRIIREDIDLSTEIAEDLWVSIDRSRLDQIVTNLVVNARDAIDADGADGAIQLTVRPRDDWVELAVRDDGIGIPITQVEQLFEPYFTTKTASRGTGLGLATVHGAVLEAGGHIEVHSEVGQGTTMVVLLPRVDRPLVRPVTPTLVPAPPTVDRPLVVLLVDDQVDVARSLGRLVQSLGWTAHVANTLDAALDILASQPVDVLLTDVVMPGANGPEVAARALLQCPELVVIFMSGHPDGLLDGVDADIPLLRKPFSRKELARTVARELSR